MKTCQSCKWVSLDVSYTKYPRCMSPNNFKISPVTGIVNFDSPEITHCVNARKFNKFCGEDGKWWEPKYEEGLSKLPDSLEEVPENKLSRLEKFVAWIKSS